MQLALVVLASCLWGVTNPFIRRASSGLERVKARSGLWQQLFAEFLFLFTNLNVS